MTTHTFLLKEKLEELNIKFITQVILLISKILLQLFPDTPRLIIRIFRKYRSG